MKRPTRFALLCHLVVILALGMAVANTRQMLLCLPGFPGTSSQAQPYVDKMLRYLEPKLGWSAGTITGLYLPDGAAASKKLLEVKPGIALVGPSIYAAHQKALRMQVIAKVEVDGRGAETYAIVTKKDGPSSLAALVGKTIEGTVVHDEKYIYNVLLDQQISPGKIGLKSEIRPLKSLRNVARGRVDGAIVDASVQRHMASLPFADELQVIYTSKPVPPPAVVVMGEGRKHAEKLKKALVGLCQRPDGQDLCRALMLTSILAASDADYKALKKAYNR
ncbi:MAG: PhnD/SsuA/transferrin family substrate-binding protein [Myxococcota bacterium]|nr:PhnD/SsuA/transferrin family substrate-binding protein [Myxococcota bacterium]